MMRGSLVLIALATAARVASAQESLEFVADRDVALQLSRIVESVRSRGLPVEPVVAKARRGAQIRAPGARIVSAAQAVARRLDVAREALGPSSPPIDIAAGEDALSTPGVTKEMLQIIHAAQPSRSVAVPVGVMAQLVASGVKPDQAATIVARLTRGGASTVQLVALGNDVNQDVLSGASAMASLQTRLETLRPLLAYIPAPVPASGLTTTGAGVADPRSRP